VPQLEQESGRSGRRPALRRRGAQIAAELLMTADVVLLLFVAWQLWGTNVDADARQHGIGHCQGTAMPGAVGNFAVAGHRQTHGAVWTVLTHWSPETGSTSRPAKATMCTCAETAR
jgi:Sortase domain